MDKSIRERIEAAEMTEWLNVGNPRLALMDILWRAGNLIPGDEHEAAIEAAERKGMDRAAQAQCLLCKQGDNPEWHETFGWCHISKGSDGLPDYINCDAAAIRAEMNQTDG